MKDTTISWWQPLDTAPRDNLRSLYLARFDDLGELQELDFNGSWESESESWEIPGVYYYWASANGIEEPTHWAYQDEPLPPVPAASLRPRLGERYLVWFDGVLQHETYQFDYDEAEDRHFWYREGLEECPHFSWERHRWLPLSWLESVADSPHLTQEGRHAMALIGDYSTPDSPQETPPSQQSAEALDAARYRWLRQQTWDASKLCVVFNPKKSVKLGAYCPSGPLLDSEIRSAMDAQEKN